jgi:hypothetical protein
VLLAVAFAVLLLPTDPRLAIAGAVPLSTLAIGVMTAHHETTPLLWLALASAPAAVVVAVARTLQLRAERPL